MAYVYGHYKADTGELFYIGKGTGRRAWVTRKRNAHWNATVAKHGVVVKILEDGLTDERAYERERELIAETGVHSLTNKADGGLGQTSDGAKRVMNNPETRRKVSEGVKRNWKTPEFKERMAQIWRNKTYSTEWRNQQSEYSKTRFDGNFAAYAQWLDNQYVGAKKRTQNKSWRDATISNNREKAKDPEFRKKLSEAGKKAWIERKRKLNGDIK